MLTKLAYALQVLVAVVLVVQLTGCIFVGRDRHGHSRYHHNDYEPSVDIRVHN